MENRPAALPRAPAGRHPASAVEKGANLVTALLRGCAPKGGASPGHAGVLAELSLFFRQRSWKKKLLIFLVAATIVPVFLDAFIFRTGHVTDFLYHYFKLMVAHPMLGVWLHVSLLTLASLVGGPDVSQDDVIGKLCDAIGLELTRQPPVQRVTPGAPPSKLGSTNVLLSNDSNQRPAFVILDRIRRSDLALTQLTDELRRDGRGDDVLARLGDALKQALAILNDLQRGELALTDLTIAASDLQRDGWMEDGFLAGLGDTMEHNSTLKGLVIDASGEVPAADYGPLFRALGRSGSIEELTLRNCNLAGEFAREVMNGFVANNAGLVTISLSGCTLDGGGVGAVAAAMPGCASLRRIDIQQCDIYDDQLVEVIRHHWMVAAQKDPAEAGRLRVELRARAAAKDGKGFAPLSRAAYYGHTGVVRLLAEDLGADVNSPDDDGATPVCMAAHGGHAEVVWLLVEDLGADASTAYDHGATPVYFAAETGHTEVVRLLVKFGVDVNTACNNGATPVYIAAQNGHAPVVRLLAELGANISTPRNGGFTPVYVAANNGHAPVVRLLAELGADVNTAMDDGSTPVLIAAQNGHADAVRVLAELGANINTPRNDGITPLRMGLTRGKLEVVKSLLLLGARFNAHDLRPENPSPSAANIRQVRADLLSWADDALAQHSTFHSTFLCGCARENTALAPLGGPEQLRAEVAQFVGIKTGVELQRLRAVRAVIVATDRG